MAQKTEMRPQETAEHRHRRHRRSRTVTLGASILILAAIGLFIVAGVIIKSAAGFVKDFVGPNESASYFEQYLEPVVMFDPESFGSISEAKPEWMIETAIWAALDDGEQSGQYAITEDGKEILPDKDVTANLKKYFGSTVKPSFKTFTIDGYTYEYNKKDRSFYIPLVAVTDFYLPRVSKISSRFKTTTLTVDYIPAKNWGQDDKSSELKQKSDKTMQIILNGSRGSYQVKAIKDIE